MDFSYSERIAMAASSVMSARFVAAFTGAGISTESGVPDFRSPGGVWDRHRIVTFQEFMNSRESRAEYWKMKCEFFDELRLAKPNRAHIALAELERMDRLDCLVTQNIDGLHQDAGSTRVIEIHGTNRRAACVKCGKSWTIEHAIEIVKNGNPDPRCDACDGYVKPATISFGQSMPEREMEEAFACAGTCDLMLMIGSSLQVEPAASVPRVAHRAGAKLIFINRTETPSDSIASLLFREPAGTVLSDIVETVRNSTAVKPL